MTELKNRLDRILENIRHAEVLAHRPPKSVMLLAVSKTWPAEAIATLAGAGQTDFGENYLQEALSKIDQLKALGLIWHFIGPIQSNKTRDIATHFDWVHSVDREKIARRLSEQRADNAPTLNVCIQVNIDNEASKSGVSSDEVMALAEKIDAQPNLTLRGMMVIPTKRIEHHAQTASFAKAYTLFKSLQQKYTSVDTLSMGMSGDMLAAIEQGSTMVRIGTALFGQREGKLTT
jgi:hypothetical protein